MQKGKVSQGLSVSNPSMQAYLREALLEQHMRSHRGVKPFVCNECGLQFTVKSNWQRHVAEHAGTRNYECEHCHKKFSRSYYLTDHLKVGVKRYIAILFNSN
jgi:uncharacterized Zn-finger protein